MASKSMEKRNIPVLFCSLFIVHTHYYISLVVIRCPRMKSAEIATTG
jgi:hypothetical protein